MFHPDSLTHKRRFPVNQLQVPFGFLTVRLWPTVPILGLYCLSKLYILQILRQGALKLASTVHHWDLLIKQKPSECTVVVASVVPQG